MKTMNRKKPMTRRGGQGGTLPLSLATGIGTSILLTLALVALEAMLLDKQILAVEQTGILAAGIWALSATVGGFLSAKLAGEKKLLVALGSGGGYALVLLLVTGMRFGAKYDGVLKGCFIILLVAAIAGFLAARPKPVRTKKHRFR